MFYLCVLVILNTCAKPQLVRYEDDENGSVLKEVIKYEKCVHVVNEMAGQIGL